MKRKHRLKSIAVFLLVFLSLILSSFPIAAEAPLNTGLLIRASAIESALSDAFEEQANELLALADEYRAGTKTPTDAEGNPIDKNEAITFLENAAAKLPTLRADTYALAIVENAYEQTYIGSYKSMATLAPDMAEVLVSLFDLSKLTSERLVADALIRAYMIAIGDKYASYSNEDEYAEYMADSQAKYGGIGVTVTQLEDGYVEVLSVTPDSPAEKAGIRLGDVIVAVEGEDFVKLGYSTAINMIRGKEGESITITVKRGEERFDVTMTRSTITEYTVTHKMLSAGDGKIGFIRISQFDEGTFAQFVEAFEELSAAGAEKFVFDVRNNLGGSLVAVLGVLEYILPEKDDMPLIRMEYKSFSISFSSVFEYIEKSGGGSEMKRAYAAAKKHQIDAPIVVLCNGFTASAGELFTSCLKDYGAAEIIGTQTYGKGMGQSGYHLTDGTEAYERSALFSLSTFYYSPPISENYEGKGIAPDTVVELSEEAAAINFYKLTEEMDGQLNAATAYLASKDGVPHNDGKDSGNLTVTVLWILFGALMLVIVALGAFLAVTVVRERKRKTSFFERYNAKSDPQEDSAKEESDSTE